MNNINGNRVLNQKFQDAKMVSRDGNSKERQYNSTIPTRNGVSGAPEG